MILEPRKIKSATVSTSNFSICSEVVGLDAMNVEYLFVNCFLNVEFKLVFFFFFFLSPLLLERFFSSFLLSAIMVVLSSYLWMLIFLPAIFIPAW